MDIFLVRHTEYSNPQNIYPGRLDIALSKNGEEHAKRIGLWFKNNGCMNLPIYSSPVLRTRQTAEIIATYINSKIIFDERLIELWYEWEGRPITYDLGTKEFFENQKRESFEDVLKRMISILEEKLNVEKTCIFVSHGEPINRLYHFLKKEKAPPVWEDKEYVKRGEIMQLTYEKKTLLDLKRFSV